MRGFAIGLCLVGAAFAELFYGGGTVAMCLGPLGVTVASCVQHTGIFPNPGLNLGHGIALGFGAVALLAAPTTGRSRGRIAVGALAAIPLGAIAYAVVRPKTLEGWTHATGQGLGNDPGPYLVLPWPFDLPSAIGYGISAAVVALFASVAVLQLRRMRGPRAPTTLSSASQPETDYSTREAKMRAIDEAVAHAYPTGSIEEILSDTERGYAGDIDIPAPSGSS
jgi:hypothetical protein